jgi:hypothetical protein
MTLASCCLVLQYGHVTGEKDKNKRGWIIKAGKDTGDAEDTTEQTKYRSLYL